MAESMFRVKVYDNFHYMDEDEATVLSVEFRSEEEAVARAKEIVEESCRHLGYDIGQYHHFGEDPAVLSPPGSPASVFSAWDYAKEVCSRHNGNDEG